MNNNKGNFLIINDIYSYKEKYNNDNREKEKDYYYKKYFDNESSQKDTFLNENRKKNIVSFFLFT